MSISLVVGSCIIYELFTIGNNITITSTTMELSRLCKYFVEDP